MTKRSIVNFVSNSGNDAFPKRLVFSGEAMIHLSGKCNLGSTIFSHNIASDIGERLGEDKRVLGHFLYNNVWTIVFCGKNRKWNNIMLEQWFFPQLMKDSQDFIYLQDGSFVPLIN